MAIELQELEEKQEGSDRAGKGTTSVAGVEVMAEPNKATLPASTDGADMVLDASDNGPASNFNAPNRENELERLSSEGKAEVDAVRKAAGEEAAADKEDA